MHSMRSRRIIAQSVRALEEPTKKKNSNDTRSPGMTAVAHNRMHENTIAIIRAFAADILPPITRSRITDKPATSNISVARFFFSNLSWLCREWFSLVEHVCRLGDSRSVFSSYFIYPLVGLSGE